MYFIAFLITANEGKYRLKLQYIFFFQNFLLRLLPGKYIYIILNIRCYKNVIEQIKNIK